MSEKVEGDRLVVSGRSAGSHFPRKQAETQQRFEADGTGREGPFHIEGSVYGRQLRFRGAGTVLGSVLGRGDVTFAEPGRAPARFLGGLHASGNVVSEPTRRGHLQSLLASVDHAAIVVRGDVIGDQVSLVDAVVFGNVRGRRVRLARCIVFGQVIADESAVLAASTVLAYEAPTVRFEGPCCVVFVAGTSVEVPVFAPYVDELGAELPCAVMFLPAMRALGGIALSHRSWEPGAGALAGARLVPADWVRAPVDTTVRRLRDGKVEARTVVAERYVLSIGGRALNFAPLVSQFGHFTWLVRTAFEFEHYAPQVQASTRAHWAERCTPDERCLVTHATAVEPLLAAVVAPAVRPAPVGVGVAAASPVGVAKAPVAPPPVPPVSASRPPPVAPVPSPIAASAPPAARPAPARPSVPPTPTAVRPAATPPPVPSPALPAAGVAPAPPRPAPTTGPQPPRPSSAAAPPRVASTTMLGIGTGTGDDPTWLSLFARYQDARRANGESTDGLDYRRFADNLLRLREQSAAAGKGAPRFDFDVREGKVRLVMRSS